MIKWLIWAIRNRGYLYDIRQLTVGGHCGLCGAWIDKAIVERGWEWSMCDKCAGKEEE